jgi:acetylornithine deacetylase/succinyl-diaminopimelate desuccinylase-like protein
MELLKQLFCIHSKSGKEGKIRKFIWNWVRQTVPDAKIECDKPGNLYITKGKSTTFPCIVAHMDQVQEKHSKDFIAYEAEDIIIGFSPKHKEQQGLGADDKCGIWISLKCLQKFEALKLAFFVGEEVGCKGSRLANMAFFDDCRFVIEPDRKGAEDLITQIGWTPLCSDDFLKDIGFKKFGYKETEGMMTDIEALKDNGLMLSCINLSCGYYRPHTNEEFVYKPALLNCLAFVEHIIKTCTKVYPHIDNTAYYERQNYYGDIYDDYYSEIYDMLTNDPTLSFGDIEAMFTEWYGRDKINRFELETSYDQAREDILFWNEEKENETTKELK